MVGFAASRLTGDPPDRDQRPAKSDRPRLVVIGETVRDQRTQRATARRALWRGSRASGCERWRLKPNKLNRAAGYSGGCPAPRAQRQPAAHAYCANNPETPREKAMGDDAGSK